MTLDDISHAAHVGHLQGRIRELEAKLQEAERARDVAQKCAALQQERASHAWGRNRDQALWLRKIDRERITWKMRAEKAERELEDRTEELAATSAVVLEVRKDREKAERERDEARACLSTFARWWHDEMRDAMQPRNDMDGPHIGEWQTCPGEVCAEARAALGETP